MKTARTKKIMAMMLSVMMVLGMMPALAFAGDEPAGDAQAYGAEISTDGSVTDPDEGMTPDDPELIEAGEPEVPEMNEETIPAPAAGPQNGGDGQQDPPANNGDGILREFGDETDPGTPCTHVMQHVAAKPATCREDGNKEYWRCDLCGNYFSDEAGSTEITDPASVVIPADPTAHQWDGGKVTTPAAPNKYGVKTYTCTVCGAARTETIVPVGTAYTIDGKNLQFASGIVQMAPSFMDSSKVDHVWLKGGKKSMTVSWRSPSNRRYVSGIIILRQTGKEKVYREVGRVGSGTTSFRDKTAKKKNRPYKYIAVAYYTDKGYTYISHVSDWAAGQTSASKKKTVTKAKISKKSVNLEYGKSTKLKVRYSSPKSTYKPKSFRWRSDNPNIATVSKGKVVAKGVGTTYIRCRLACGKDKVCKVTVTGAFKPAAPVLKVDVADESSITLIWNSVKRADSYILYQSTDGKKWTKSYTVNDTTKKVTGLKKGKLYYFYIVAQHVNGSYKAVSDRSKVISQKAVEKLRETSVSGFPSSKTAKVGTTIKISVKVTVPEGRTASLQMKSNGSWTTKKSVKLPKGTDKSSVSITFPNDWESGSTQWRLSIPKSKTATAYNTGTLTITAETDE